MEFQAGQKCIGASWVVDTGQAAQTRLVGSNQKFPVSAPLLVPLQSAGKGLLRISGLVSEWDWTDNVGTIQISFLLAGVGIGSKC